MTSSSWLATLAGAVLLLSAPIVLAQGTSPAKPANSAAGCTFNGIDRSGVQTKVMHADEGQEVNSRTATYVCHNGKLIKKG